MMTQTDDQKSADLPCTPVARQQSEIPTVVVHTSRRISLLWLLPLLASLIGGWLAYKTIAEKGPDITISFQTANGLVAGKTRIKYKAVDIGIVESIALNDTLSGVVVGARMARSAEPYLLEGSKFWVVRPRLSLRGVSGLDTLVTGAHIEIEPGEGTSARNFKGLETPRVVRMDAPGGKYVLQTESLGSLDAGSPLYYHGIAVGEVLGYTLSKSGKNVDIHLFIRAPYHQLVQESTRFWKVSGIDVSVNAGGIDFKTESLQSMWMGGVAFDTPDTLKKSGKVSDDHLFWLYESKSATVEQAYSKKILLFILYFDESVRGLSVGAPVEFRGIKVGKVADIRMEYDSKNTTFRIPVLVQIEPDRINDNSGEQTENDDSSYVLLNALIKRGLRAQLQTGNYLTGQRFVELDLHPDTPLRLSGLSSNFPELPTIPGSMGEMTTSITRLLKTLQALPLIDIATELHGTLKGTNRVANAPELLETIHTLKEAAIAMENALNSFTKQSEAVGGQAEGAAVAAIQALVQTEKTLSTIENVIHPNSPLHYSLVEVTKELSATARTIRFFIELLETKPESLLFGKERQR